MILKFEYFVFKHNTNTTIRRGIKTLAKNDKITLTDYNETKVLSAIVENVRYKLFRDLTEDDIANEHDGECQNYCCLEETMNNCYENFDESELITIIDFRLDKQ